MSLEKIKLYDTREEFEERRARYERNKMPYVLKSTMNSSEIRSDQMGHTHITSNTFFSIKDRNFIGRVSSDIKRRLQQNLIKVPDQDPEKYNYCQVNTFKQIQSDLIEIDINSAYWTSAKLQGIISDGTYVATEGDLHNVRLSKECIKDRFQKVNPEKYFKIISRNNQRITILINNQSQELSKDEYHYKYRPTKEVRLAALGALAKQVTCFYFDGVSLKQTGIEKPNEIEARLWKMICHKVYELFDRIMRTIPEKDFVLYWVDALIIKKSSKEIVTKMIEQAGFTWKEKTILGAEISNGIIRISDPKGKFRTFKFKTR